MSKINAVRIVNLNYNNNSIKVNDEIYEFGGESTLMSLRNGGGKTVLVQMLMAPFVNARYRDLKDRKFESYFTSSTPTYILVEWMLDNNSTYVLTGMGIKKQNASADEELKDNLDIFTFIHEYKEGNEYDIHNFPVTEKTDRGFKVKNFSSMKKIMDELKTDKQYIFDYFDLNVDPQRRKYFDTLKQYNINHREWESIIRRINLKESGLSDLFQDAKTVSGLVEKWFLPTVEDKLNEREDKIKNFQDIMKKFIYQYKENESKIIRKTGIEEFKAFSSKILNSAEEFRSVKLNTESIKNDIANLHAYIESEIMNLSDEKSDLQTKFLNLNEELNEIEYERLSFEYHEIDEKLNNLMYEESELQKVINSYEEEIKSTDEDIAIEECARLYQQYKEASKNVQAYENELEIAKAEDAKDSHERDNLGFTLRKLYEDMLENENSKLESKNVEKEDKEKTINELRQNEENLNAMINKVTGEKSEFKAKIEFYNREEDNFNKKYNKFLKRNIMGEYDEVLLNAYNKDFDGRYKKIQDEYTGIIKKQEEIRRRLPEKRKELEDAKVNKSRFESELTHIKEKIATMEKSIDEIKKILLYCSIDDSRIFDNEFILKQIKRKIETLKTEESLLNKELDGLDKEKKMYETGRNVRLSREIEDRLEVLNINRVFGLEWLKKQNLSLKQKEDLISKNPFLPYSLIMSRDNLDKLKSEEAKVFTSFPLPIIEKEKLEDNLDVIVANDVYTLGNVSFLIAFNRKILNGEELKKLIEGLSAKIKETEEQIKIKSSEIDKYTKDWNRVEVFDIKKSNIDDIHKKEDEIKFEAENANKNIGILIDEVNSLETDEKRFNSAVKDMDGKINHLEDEKNSFASLLDDYEKYINNKEGYGLKVKELDAAKDDKDKLDVSIKKENENLNTINSQINELKFTYRLDKEKSNKYLSYNQGEIINRDMEDIEARFLALSGGIGLKVKELEDIISQFNKTFKGYEDELLKKSKEFSLKESQFNFISYDEVRVNALKSKNKKNKKELDNKKNEIHDLQIKKNVMDNDRKHKMDEIQALNREMPKDKMYINNFDFKERKSIKNGEIDLCKKEIKKTDDYIVNLCSSRDKMSEFAGFEVTDEKTLEYPLDEVESIREDLKKSYIENIELESEKEEMLSGCCQELSNEERFTKDEFFKNTIDILQEIKNNPDDVIKTLETVNDVHVKMLNQLETDLSKIDEEKKNIVDMFYDYVEQVFEHIGRIDDNSSININGRYLKMLNIKQPEWEEREEQYRLLSKDFVENIIKSCLDELSSGHNIEELLSKEITTKKLYDNIAGISEIEIKLYKIEASKQIPISWNQVSENSGGEGFLSAFVILTSLLSYMRKEESDIFKNSEEGKVIIMDNPFAQTNAEHLLKPLMEIAKKNNTQLICFTGLGGDSIYNRFDNIYVLNLVDSKLKPGMQFIESEHTKGEELTHITSSRFKIQVEKAEQMRLF